VTAARPLAVTTDVTQSDQVKRLVDTGIEQFGRIDVMINNAGIMPRAPLERLTIDDWDRTVDVNIKGVLYVIAAALPHMQERKSKNKVTRSRGRKRSLLSVQRRTSNSAASGMGKAPAVNETLGKVGLAEVGIVRPQAHPLVIARDGDNAAIVQHIGHAEIMDQAVIIKFTPLRRADVACAGAGVS
jgi:short chain dehydrogenase